MVRFRVQANALAPQMSRLPLEKGCLVSTTAMSGRADPPHFLISIKEAFHDLAGAVPGIRIGNDHGASLRQARYA